MIAFRLDADGPVHPLVFAEPADVPFLGVLVARGVPVDADDHAVDVLAALAGFEFHRVVTRAWRSARASARDWTGVVRVMLAPEGGVQFPRSCSLRSLR